MLRGALKGHGSLLRTYQNNSLKYFRSPVLSLFGKTFASCLGRKYGYRTNQDGIFSSFNKKERKSEYIKKKKRKEQKK